MGCCASSDNVERPAGMRNPGSPKTRKDHQAKDDGVHSEEPIVISTNPKTESNPKELKLDLSKIVGATQSSASKPHTKVNAKPDETGTPKATQPKHRTSETKPSGSTFLQEPRTPLQQAVKEQFSTPTKSNADVEANKIVQKKEAPTSDTSPQKGSNLNNKGVMSNQVGDLQKESSNKNSAKDTSASEANNDKLTVAELKNHGSTKNTADLKVSPDIFVSLKTGSIGEHYKVGQVLGEGAYGKVSIVTHRTTGIMRAMKSIKKKSVLKEEAEKLFAEVSILKELDHPNIVKLYELFQDQDCYYLVTEFCTGGELFDRIQQMQSFSEKQAAEYMKQILSAVVYCHSKNIVHRDLKPENLLLDSKKSDAALKVIDFGTSRKFTAGKKMTQKFGTPYYIAPEVLSKSYDEKCDVWSCGVILYILLCGYPPFNGRTDADIINKVKTGRFHFDDAEWSRISSEAKTLIKKMLTYDPAKRISAREALDDPWMQKNARNMPFNKKVLENLSSFSSKNKLKQAILTFIVTQVTSQTEKDELQKTFQQLDKDKNGILTKDELVAGYIRVYGSDSRAKAEQEAMRIIQEVDVNGSGEIDFTEFIMAAMNKEMLLSKQKIAQAFRLFDQDGDGFITRQELSNVMGGIAMDDEDWKSIIEEVDLNGDGKISQDEFVTLLTKSAITKKVMGK